MAKAKKSTATHTPVKRTKAESNAQLDIVITQLESEFGEGIIKIEDGPMTMRRHEMQIPSGSIGLDMALGPMFRKGDGYWQTGYVMAKMLEIFGPESSGKTTLCLHLIANAQVAGRRCAFLDMEHALDPFYARGLGVQMGDLLISQPKSGDECLSIAEKLLKSNMLDVIVIDSVAALVPESELAGEMGDSQMGAQARLMSQACRKFESVLGTNSRTLIVFTNQLRSKMNTMGFGPQQTTTGGVALKYAASYRIDVRKGPQINVGAEGQARTIGHRMLVKVVKNKLGIPFREADIPLIYGKGVDSYMELVELATSYGVLELNGSWYRYHNKGFAQGIHKATEMIAGDPALRYHIYNETLEMHMHNIGYSPIGDQLPDFVQPKSPVMSNDFIPQLPEPAAPVEVAK